MITASPSVSFALDNVQVRHLKLIQVRLCMLVIFIYRILSMKRSHSWALLFYSDNTKAIAHGSRWLNDLS